MHFPFPPKHVINIENGLNNSSSCRLIYFTFSYPLPGSETVYGTSCKACTCYISSRQPYDDGPLIHSTIAAET